ncbi:MAG: dTMP kinase [Gemmatimonadota bacterium]
MSSTTTEATPSPRPGLFLVLEGVEGSGKSSQQALLSRRMEGLGIPHLSVREPGGTPAGEGARAIVLDRNLSMTPETELLLYLAARAEFVRSVVRPALERGEIVLADRYELSTFAYQGIGRGLGLERVRELNNFATGGLRPDATFLLVLDSGVGKSRQLGEADRLERESEVFHRTVAQAYDSLADTEPNVTRIAGDEPVQSVQEALWKELVTRWPDRFADGQR